MEIALEWLNTNRLIRKQHLLGGMVGLELTWNGFNTHKGTIDMFGMLSDALPTILNRTSHDRDITRKLDFG